MVPSCPCPHIDKEMQEKEEKEVQGKGAITVVVHGSPSHKITPQLRQCLPHPPIILPSKPHSYPTHNIHLHRRFLRSRASPSHALPAQPLGRRAQ